MVVVHANGFRHDTESSKSLSQGGDELALHSSFLWAQGKNPFIYHCERNKLFSHDDLPKALETIKTEKMVWS